MKTLHNLRKHFVIPLSRFNMGSNCLSKYIVIHFLKLYMYLEVSHRCLCFPSPKYPERKPLTHSFPMHPFSTPEKVRQP